MSLRRSYVTAGLGPTAGPCLGFPRTHRFPSPTGFIVPAELCLLGRAWPQGGVRACVRVHVSCACVCCVPLSWHSWLPIRRVRAERAPGTASQNRGEGPGGSALGSRQR